MKREEIAVKVTEMLVDKFGVDEKEAAKESNNLQDDLGADSIDFIGFIIDIEREFDIGITDDDADRIETVGDIINYLFKAVQ